MIASETRNHCAAVVMDLSTRPGPGGGGDSNDSGNGRRRSGAGRPAKSVFSIRSLVGEDSPVVQRDRNDDDEHADDRMRRHHRLRDAGDNRDDDDNPDAGEFCYNIFFLAMGLVDRSIY